MIERLARRDSAVFLLLAAYFLVNLIVRITSPGNLEFDEAQQMFFSQGIAIGYDSQPPFYNWLQYGFVQLFGVNHFALALLKNLMLFFSYVFFGLTAQLIVRDRVLAVIATLGLITFPHVSYEAQRDLSHTVALLFACCAFFYFFVRTLLSPTLTNYALTGVAIGIGVLSKYNFVLLPMAAGAALLWDPQWRSRLFNPGVLVAALAALVLAGPHILWFFDNAGQATGETLGKLNPETQLGYLATVGEGLLSLAEALGTLVLPTLAIFAIAFGRAFFRSWSAQDQWTGFFGRLFPISAVLLVGFVLLGLATDIKVRWVMPFFLPLPIYLAAKMRASGEQFSSVHFGRIVLAIMILVPLLIFFRPFSGLAGRYSKHNIPYRAAITEILAAEAERPTLILTNDQQLAGNIRLYVTDIPVAMPGYEFLVEPLNPDPEKPVLVIWRGDANAPSQPMNSAMTEWVWKHINRPVDPSKVNDLGLPYQLGRAGDGYHFGYAWVPAAPGT